MYISYSATGMTSVFSLFIMLFSLMLAGMEGSNEVGPDFAPVFLTLSSLYREAVHSTVLIDREVQIHWMNGSVDKIELYDKMPQPDAEPILQFKTMLYPEGFFETNITFGNPPFPGGWESESEEAPIPGDHCMPLYVIAWKGEQLIYSDCFKIKPTWMHDNKLALESMNLTYLFLPGTHNSGSYRRGQSLSQRDAAGRYIITQDQSVWNQLVYGVRYLDLRIGYYSTKRNLTDETEYDDCFWINHDLIKVRPLLPLLQDVKNFLEKTKEEIVIIDIHRFPLGFHGRPARHQQLVNLLERELKKYALPYLPNYTPTLGDLWHQGKRIILSYGENSIAKDHDWLWPPIRQLWGNKQNVDDLYEHLERCMTSDNVQEERRGVWAAMAQLTPGPLDLLLNPKGSLRQMAHQVNKNLTKWCRDRWWKKANIIAMDFFLGTDLINTAVAANIFKGNAAKQYLTY